MLNTYSTVQSTSNRSPSKLSLQKKTSENSMRKFCSLHFSLMALRAIFGGRTRHRLVFMVSIALTKKFTHNEHTQLTFSIY